MEASIKPEEETMKFRRRQLLQFGAAALVATAGSPVAWAQAYPTRPVRIIIGWPAGGVADIVARLMGQWLSERLGQPFVIENRTGAATNLATEAVIRAPADAYTLLWATAANATNATFYEKLNFNFVGDIAPIASIIDLPLVMVVNPSFPAKTVPAFIAYAKANPGKINMASAGSGNPNHIAGELFKMMSGIDMLHVPYRGDPPAITDLIGGQVQVYFSTMGTSIEYIRAGKLRPLAVTTATRLEVLPDLPTLSDFLPGYEASSWQGLVAPKNTPAAIVDTLNKLINTALIDPRMKARFAELGVTVLSGSPTDFAKLIASDTEKWAKVIRFAGMKPD
jgi:tripartite-type tricarboxylate transporter receptor subunit TctC